MFLVDMTFVDMEKITAKLTDQHRAYMQQQYQANTLMFGGRKVPRTGGIIISMHDNEQALRLMLAADPFIQSGAVSYSVSEFIPVMASPAYQQILT
jgi:uncharacterized protein YciI